MRWLTLEWPRALVLKCRLQSLNSESGLSTLGWTRTDANGKLKDTPHVPKD